MLMFIQKPLNAYYPLDWEDLNFQMRFQANWYRIRMETRVEVFDPFATNLDRPEVPVSRIIPLKGCKQIIHWKRDEMINIETRDAQGQLLHIYYEYKDEIIEQQIYGQRVFKLLDVMPHYLRFLSRNQANRDRALAELNIDDHTVSQQWYGDRIYYRIGLPGSGNFVLLDSKTFELNSAHGSIRKADGSEWKLKILFSQFEKFSGQRFPRTTKYLLDDRLFKKVSVVSLKTIQILPFQELKKIALARLQAKNAYLDIDYAL